MTGSFLRRPFRALVLWAPKPRAYALGSAATPFQGYAMHGHEDPKDADGKTRRAMQRIVLKSPRITAEKPRRGDTAKPRA